MREVYDYVPIDSRTGVSDTSGICTVQMPDVLVVCFTLNNQSIEGASAVAKSAFMQRAEMAKSPNQAGIAPPRELEVYPVPTRIDSSELDRLAMRWAYARKLFAQFPANISEEERDSYWREISVPNVPYYSYEELLAPIGDRPDFPVGLMRPTAEASFHPRKQRAKRAQHRGEGTGKVTRHLCDKGSGDQTRGSDGQGRRVRDQWVEA